MITTALIGSPVEHSVSPKLFNLYASEHNLEYAHSKFDVSEENFERVIKALPAFGFSGVNITLPYKTDVITYLDDITPEAKNIGAVNTIKVEKGQLIGCNTDAYGAIKAIEKAFQKEITNQHTAIVMGTGGAARAIVWGLLEKGVEVKVIYRNPKSKRTINLESDLKDKVNFLDYEKLNSNDILNCSILCNATSAGMFPDHDGSPLNLKLLEQLDLSNMVLFDAIFNPVRTKLQQSAVENGATLAYGIDMMVYQGVVAFEYWTGKKVSDETVQKAREMLMNND